MRAIVIVLERAISSDVPVVTDATFLRTDSTRVYFDVHGAEVCFVRESGTQSRTKGCLAFKPLDPRDVQALLWVIEQRQQRESEDDDG